MLIALNVIVYAFQTRYPGITKAGWKVQYAVLAFVDATLLGLCSPTRGLDLDRRDESPQEVST